MGCLCGKKGKSRERKQSLSLEQQVKVTTGKQLLQAVCVGGRRGLCLCLLVDGHRDAAWFAGGHQLQPVPAPAWAVVCNEIRVKDSALTIQHQLLLVQDFLPLKHPTRSCAINPSWGVEVLTSQHREPHGNMCI